MRIISAVLLGIILMIGTAAGGAIPGDSAGAPLLQKKENKEK